MPIDYEFSKQLLGEAFARAESAYLSGDSGVLLGEVDAALDEVCSSNTQAYREALLGCLLARINDKAINIRQPYVSQSADAFSGRSLDEQVVNPALQERRIPSSRGPFLSVFRRSVEFTAVTRDGLRDKSDYDAFLSLLGIIEALDDDDDLDELLVALARRFVEIREASVIPLTHIQRMSLDQTVALVGRLLETQSGGRLPMYIVIAAFEAVSQRFALNWDVLRQGINVADAASKAEGDVVVRSGETTLIAAEVTERLVDRNRVLSTFNNKIGPNPMDDYLFFVLSGQQPDDTIQQMRQYFAQGHEINFVVILPWIHAVLSLIGGVGRTHFIEQLLVLLEEQDTPAVLRVAWNEAVNAVISNGGS